MLISADYHPYRLSVSHKEPVRLTIKLRNEAPNDKMVTFELALDGSLSLDKTGFRSSDSKRFDKFPAKGIQTLQYDIWPKGWHAQAGEVPVNVRVYEHHDSFAYVEREYTKRVPLTVID